MESKHSRTNGNTKMIQIKNLYKNFTFENKRVSILSNINLTIKKNESVVIYGKSGSGKSTLLNILASILKPSSGELLVDKENIASLSDIHASAYRRNRLGFITQSFHLFDELTLYNNLLAPLVIQNLTKDQIENAINNALKLANISHKKEYKVSTLSKGERQRCIIARAIVNNPDILICDEPTANLDSENSFIFIETLKQLKKEGKTLIIATHDPIFKTQKFVDRVLTLEDTTLE